jgi:hypothetical protein
VQPVRRSRWCVWTKRRCLTTSNVSSSAMLRSLSSPVLNRIRLQNHNQSSSARLGINLSAGNRAVVVAEVVVQVEAEVPAAQERAANLGRVALSHLEAVVRVVAEVTLEVEAAAAQSPARVNDVTAYAVACALKSLLLPQPRWW